MISSSDSDGMAVTPMAVIPMTVTPMAVPPMADGSLVILIPMAGRAGLITPVPVVVMRRARMLAALVGKLVVRLGIWNVRPPLPLSATGSCVFARER